MDFLDVRISVVASFLDRSPVAGDAAHVITGCHPLTLSCLLHLGGVVVKVVFGEAKDGETINLLTR